MSLPRHPDQLEICVCTFRRPQLRETLLSLAQVRAPDALGVSILVVDNDDTPSARDLVEGLVSRMPYPLRYIHRPFGNISIARNGALDESRARFLAFIDDDEIAPPDWLCALVETRNRTGADVVLGPVDVRYPDAAPEWMPRTSVHATRPVWVDGVIQTGYTCNVLMDRAAASLEGLRFDPDFGQTGGEDTRFFGEITRRGGQIAYAERAVLHEDVPPARATMRWLLRRHYRMGQTHALVHGGAAHPAGALPALSKLVYCGGSALIGVFDAARRNRAILRGTLHLGVMSGHLGGQSARHYGAPEVTQR